MSFPMYSARGAPLDVTADDALVESARVMTSKGVRAGAPTFMDLLMVLRVQAVSYFPGLESALQVETRCRPSILDHPGNCGLNVKQSPCCFVCRRC